MKATTKSIEIGNNAHDEIRIAIEHFNKLDLAMKECDKSLLRLADVLEKTNDRFYFFVHDEMIGYPKLKPKETFELVLRMKRELKSFIGSLILEPEEDDLGESHESQP